MYKKSINFLTTEGGEGGSVLARAFTVALTAACLLQGLAFRPAIGCRMDHMTRSTRHAAATIGITARPAGPSTQPAVHH